MKVNKLIEEYSIIEQKALEEERKEKEWQKTYGKKFPVVVEKMNLLLAKREKNAITELKNMFLDKELLENYKQVDLYANMYVILAIYELEDEAGIQHTILEQGQTVETLVKYLFLLKMIFYRFDFEIGDDVGWEIIQFIKEHHTSDIVIQIMLKTQVMRPVLVALKLEKLFSKYGMKDYEFSVLKFADLHWRGNYRIQKKLLVEYEQKEYESDVQKYEDEISKLSKTSQNQHLELQEILWKALYAATDSVDDLVAYLKNNDVGNDLWSFLLSNMIFPDKEVYAKIIFALLDERFFDKAEYFIQHELSMYPDDELLLCLLAERYLDRRDFQQTLECLNKITQPTEITERMKKLCIGMKENDG